MAGHPLTSAGAESWHWAADLAKEMLASAGERLRHTEAVGQRAFDVRWVIASEDQALLVASAWLHDIGYAPAVAQTGFHPLDGARFLEAIGAPDRVVNLVANHSCARFEAWERDLLSELTPYQLEVGPVADALIYVDMTTGPTGRTVSVEQRLAEILRRYEQQNPVHRAIAEASEEIEAAVSRVEARLAQAL